MWMIVIRSLGQLLHNNSMAMKICKLFSACPVKFIHSRSTFKTTLNLRLSKKFLIGLFDTVRQIETIFTPSHYVHCLTQKYLSENIDASPIFQRLALHGHTIVNLNQIHHRFVSFVVPLSCLRTFGTFSSIILIALSFNQNLLDPLLLSHLWNYTGYFAPDMHVQSFFVW